jgi:hypothetical protein
MFIYLLSIKRILMSKSVSQKGKVPAKKKVAKKAPAKKGATKKAAKKSPAKKAAVKKAPIKKAATKKSAPKKARPGGGRLGLLGLTASTTGTADFTFEFFEGVATATVTLFRAGQVVDSKDITDGGTLHFDNVRSRDTVSVKGTCTGTGKITVNVDTRPASPTQLSAGKIIERYTIL